MPCSVKRIGRRTSDRLSPRRLCISAKNVTFVLHFPCVARKRKTAPPWEPSNFLLATMGDWWSPLQYEKVLFRFSSTANRKTRKARRRVVARVCFPFLLASLFVCFPFRLLPFLLPRQPKKKHERGFGKGGRGENLFFQKGSPPAL